MNTEQFCYWLQGFSELTPEQPTPEQWQSIKEHLATVFRKVTPPSPGFVGSANPMRDGLDAQRAQDAWRAQGLGQLGQLGASIKVPQYPALTC